MWLTGLVAPWHVGSSQTGARTRVPCIGRQILNHCATREARLQIVFKENSGLPSDIDSSQVAFNSMFINGLNLDLPLLVKRTMMEWETISTEDLVNLANQFSQSR